MVLMLANLRNRSSEPVDSELLSQSFVLGGVGGGSDSKAPRFIFESTSKASRGNVASAARARLNDCM